MALHIGWVFGCCSPRVSSGWIFAVAEVRIIHFEISRQASTSSRCGYLHTTDSMSQLSLL